MPGGSSGTKNGKNWKKLPNTFLVGFVVATGVENCHICSEICDENPKCVSYIYNEKTKQCSINYGEPVKRIPLPKGKGIKSEKRCPPPK